MPTREVRTTIPAPGKRRPASEACEHCGGPLTGRQRNFCSKLCKAAWHRRKTDVARLEEICLRVLDLLEEMKGEK